MDNNKIIQHHIPWEKICFAIVLAFFFIFGILVIRFRVTYHDPMEIYHAKVKCEFVWDGVTYKGSYDGEFQNTQPNGYGTFTGVNDSIIYVGEWEKGFFSGNGKIDYGDGSIEEGEFLNGKRNGRIKKYSSESAYNEKTYIETIYDMDTPYARSDSYEKSELISSEYYVNAISVSSIKQNAKLLTEKLIQRENYYNTYIYVEGVVEFVGETAQSCYFRVNTDTVGMVIGGYENTYDMASNQRLIPTLKKGDKVTLYGYYTGVAKNNVHTDTEGHDNKLPKIIPFLVEVNESDDKKEIRKFNDKISEITYNNLLDNPCRFSMDEVEDTFIVLNTERAGLTYTIMGYKEDKPDEIYALIYKGITIDRFTTGSEVKIKGYIDGQTKIVSSETTFELIDEKDNSGEIKTYDFTRYPVLKVEEIE